MHGGVSDGRVSRAGTALKHCPKSLHSTVLFAAFWERYNIFFFFLSESSCLTLLHIELNCIPQFHSGQEQERARNLVHMARLCGPEEHPQASSCLWGEQCFWGTSRSPPLGPA